MKVFTQKSILQKIIIAIIIVILFNFIAPNICRAIDDDENWGGVLFTPIQALSLAFGDGIMYIISSSLMGESIDNVVTLSTSSTLGGAIRTVITVIRRTTNCWY